MELVAFIGSEGMCKAVIHRAAFFAKLPNMYHYCRVPNTQYNHCRNECVIHPYY